MPVNSIIDLTFAGEYCSVPVSISLAYKQLADDAPGEDTGERLIRLWFDTIAVSGGPWRYIRPFMSDELGFACATASYGNTSTAAFLTGAVGLNTDPASPSPLALQVNTPAQNPHPNASAGRFFLPGLTIPQLQRCGVVQSHSQVLLQFYLNLLEIDDLGGGQGGRYHLIPHAKYVDREGGIDDVLAGVPYPNLMMKIIGSRRSDACQAFLSGGAGGGFEEIIVPPTEPSVIIQSPADEDSNPLATPISWEAEVFDWDAVECQISTSKIWDGGTFVDLPDEVEQVFTRTGIDSSWLGLGTHTLFALSRNLKGEQVNSEGITYHVT